MIDFKTQEFYTNTWLLLNLIILFAIIIKILI